MKKIIYDDSCQFCIGSVNKYFDETYELIGASELSEADQKKLKEFDLSKEILMIDDKGKIKRNVDVFLDSKKGSIVGKIANIKPIHAGLHKLYRMISKIRYKIR